MYKMKYIRVSLSTSSRSLEAAPANSLLYTYEHILYFDTNQVLVHTPLFSVFSLGKLPSTASHELCLVSPNRHSCPVLCVCVILFKQPLISFMTLLHLDFFPFCKPSCSKHSFIDLSGFG